MPIAEWENLSLLVTPEGSLSLNNPDSPDGYFLTAKDGAESGSGIRSTGDPVPQGGGTIWHRGFDNGYVVKIPVFYYVNETTPANALSTPTSQEMDDLLMRHMRSILNGGGRLFYNPTGLPQRLLDQLQLVAQPTVTEADAQTGTVIQLGSPFPYLIDFTQIETDLSAGSPSATLTNTGSAPYFPVFQVFGPFSDFTLTNSTTGKAVIYSDALPGAVPVGSGDYIEISTFQNSVYLNGNGASRKAGIDILNSEFFTLEVGDNDLTITSAGTAPNVKILWQAAWF